MKAVKDTIGQTTILIEVLEDPLQVLGEEGRGRSTVPTDIAESITNVYTKVKSVIKNIAADVGTEIQAIPVDAKPTQLEMEFNLSISAQGGPIFVFSGKGEGVFRVKMSWDLRQDNPHA